MKTMEYYFEFDVEPDMVVVDKKIKAQSAFKIMRVVIADNGNATAHIKSTKDEVDLIIPAFLLQFAKKVGTY